MMQLNRLVENDL